VSKNPATFDLKKLDWINGQYLQAMTDEQFSLTQLVPQLMAAGLEAGADAKAVYGAKPQWFDLLSSILKPRTTLAPQVVEKSRFLYWGDDVQFDEKSVNKNLAKDGTRAYLEAAHDALEKVDAAGWDAAAIDAALEPLPEALGTNKRKFYGAVRVAECGNQVSPPLGESLQLLGRDVALARLQKALPLAK
jgi:glutamyl-tRNA synthetase